MKIRSEWDNQWKNLREKRMRGLRKCMLISLERKEDVLCGKSGLSSEKKCEIEIKEKWGDHERNKEGMVAR